MSQPLAERLRPKTLDDYIGQKHLVGQGAVLRKMIDAGRVPSFILWVILRGNVMDMAVGVIVGGAFTSIVTSLNADILTPILGIFGGTDFSYLTVTLGTGENAPVLHYGNFITAVINFLITALVIFIMLKVINQITEKLSTLAGMEEEKPEPTTKKCPFCYSEIDIRATRCPHCTSVLDEQE